MKKSIIATILSALLLATVSVPVLANDVTQPGTSDQTVNYTKGEEYTVTIPASVNLGQTADITATKMNVNEGTTIKVVLTSTTNDFKVKETSGSATIDYEVKKDQTKVNKGEAVATFTKSSHEKVTLSFEKTGDDQSAPAGSYTDSITYTISKE